MSRTVLYFKKIFMLEEIFMLKKIRQIEDLTDKWLGLEWMK